MIGDKIKELREARMLTQAQMSEQTGININTLASYERNIREPRIDVIMQLSAFFGVSTDYLLGISPYQNIAHQEAVDRAFSGLPHKMREELSSIQLDLVRAADVFRFAKGSIHTAGELFNLLADDMKRVISAYVHLVEDNTPETNWESAPDFFVDAFMAERAQMSQNISQVVNCIYQRGEMGVEPCGLD